MDLYLSLSGSLIFYVWIYFVFHPASLTNAIISVHSKLITIFAIVIKLQLIYSTVITSKLCNELQV